MKYFDIHIHPSMKSYLLGKDLNTDTFQYFDSLPDFIKGMWNPFVFRSNIQNLKKGDVNRALASIYLPEQKMINDCKLIVDMFYPLFKIFGKKRIAKRYKSIIKEKDRFNATKKIITSFRKEVLKHSESAEIVTNLKDFNRVINDDKIAFILSIEGAHSLNGDLENINKFYDMGVRSITLAHFYENLTGKTVGGIPDSIKKTGCFTNSIVQVGGLSSFGNEVVNRMLDLKMLIDLTHCTFEARQEIISIHAESSNQVPLIASHVGAYEYRQHPMNLKKEEIRAISDTGGVIGVIFMNEWLSQDFATGARNRTEDGLEYIIKTLEVFKNSGGIECVSIGSDFDGLTDVPNDIYDSEQMPKLVKGLLESNKFSLNEIEQIMSKNANRVIEEIL